MKSHDTADLLESVAGFVDRYVELRAEAEQDTVALWVLHSWVPEAAFTTPYLAVLSPEKRSGKTRLLEVLESLCARPWRVLGPSEAVLYRTLDARKPTLLIDEVDGLFNSSTERSEPLRTLLNSGNRRGTVVPRCVGPNLEVRDFEVFGPKVLAGIDNRTFPETVRDRSIVVKMQRKTTPRERWLPREIEQPVAEVRDWLESWADGVRDRLERARPDLPTDLDDRAAEGWEALLAIADLAGESWPDRARRAALELSAGASEEEESRGVRLLRDVQAAFDDREVLSTAELLEALNALDESPWGAWHQGEGLRPRDLARLLRPYEVRSQTVRLSDTDTPKGYKREAFEDPWARYLSEAPQAPQPPQAGFSATESSLWDADVADVADVADSRGCDNGRPATHEEEAELERLRAKLGPGGAS